MEASVHAIRYSRPVPDWQARSALILHDLRLDVADCLELADSSAWSTIIEAAVNMHGGSMTAASQSGWGPHWCELALLQITGTGDTFEEAVRDWAKCARRAAASVDP